MLHRCLTSNIAFQSYWKMWMRGPKISLSKWMLLYNAMVVSVMLYNSGSWAVPVMILYKLDACHRCHLRSIMGMRWPNRIVSNEDLYVCCGIEPLSQRVRRMRRSIFGHVLRILEDSHAQLALEFAIVGSGLTGVVSAGTQQSYLACYARTSEWQTSDYDHIMISR